VLSVVLRTIALVVFKDSTESTTREARNIRHVLFPGVWPIEILDKATGLTEREVYTGRPRSRRIEETSEGIKRGQAAKLTNG
jgi:hypothetical protein